MYTVIGHDTVVLRDLEFAPPWLVREKELGRSVRGCQREWLPPEENLISIHVAYKMKFNWSWRRVYAHMGTVIRRRTEYVRTVLRPISCYSVDVNHLSSTRLQVGLCRYISCLSSIRPYREIFVRPPNEHRALLETLRKLLKLPYGISEAGSQWKTVCESCLLSNDVGFWKVMQYPNCLSYETVMVHLGCCAPIWRMTFFCRIHDLILIGLFRKFATVSKLGRQFWTERWISIESQRIL